MTIEKSTTQILGLCNLQNAWKKDGDGKVRRGHYRGDLGSEGVECLNHSCRSAWQFAALHEGCEEDEPESLGTVKRQTRRMDQRRGNNQCLQIKQGEINS
jgi:hypothetical protein